MTLCSNCQLISSIPIFYHDWREQTIYTHDARSLAKAVAEHCFFCTQWWNSIRVEEFEALVNTSTFIGIDCKVISFDTDSTFRLRFEPQWDGTINEDLETGVSEFLLISDMVLAADLSSEDLDLHKSNPDNVDLDAVPEVLSLHTNHESTWVAIKQWLQRCQGRHTDCNDLRSHPAWLPTRLLDTGLDDKDCIRVVDTVNLAPDSVTYIALSHCWGKKHFLVMNENSKNMFQTGPGVPVSALALNFQDAIHATRKLGLRYVWIDSFCILQGSREDWQLEAPMMNKVYRNAILTLAPTASSDAYGGLFRARDPALVLPYKMQITVKDPETDDVAQRIIYAVPRYSWKFQVAESALGQRAWVLQERVLSRRTVYFGEDQIFWECRELAASSTFMDGLPGRLLGDENVRPKNFQSDVKQRLDAGPRGADWYGPWRELLRAYTTCDITNPMDKLVAISGMAKEFSLLLEDEYAAGLWRKNLVDDLLWYTIEVPGRYARRPESYRAPSWSWASVDAPVLFADDLDVEEYVQVLHVEINPVHTDLTMEIRSASIFLCGYLIETTILRDEDEIGRTWYFDTKENHVQGRYVCFPLRNDIMGRLWGLILCAATGSKDGVYTRVGVFNIETGYRLDIIANETRQIGSVREDFIVRDDDWEWFNKGDGHVGFIII
ncbi:putative Heterokaryon incompatibility protein [Seiridium cardinale]